MSALRQAEERPLLHVRTGQGPEVLARIVEDDVNLAIWERGLSAAVAADAARMLRCSQAPILLECAVPGLGDAVAAASAGAGWPDAPALRADMVALATRFAAIMGMPAVSLRLEMIEGDACRKYHADYVTARLITSYAGPGSQWLSNDEADALAAGVRPELMMPSELLAGEVALFKGRRWTHRPIIHRSPPIAGTGQRRLVLVINPADVGADGGSAAA